MIRASWLVLVLLASAGCGTSPDQAGAQAGDRSDTPSSASGAKGDDTKGTVVDLDGLQSRTPADWKPEEATNRMRAYQFRLPAVKDDKDDAELVVFYFGPGGGGTADNNITRWKGMFVPPEGKTLKDIAKVEKSKVGDVDVAYLDIQGTYRYKARPFDPNAKEELRSDYRMLGVVFESPKGPYFFRLVGPAKTVEHFKKGFDEWLHGFK